MAGRNLTKQFLIRKMARLVFKQEIFKTHCLKLFQGKTNVEYGKWEIKMQGCDQQFIVKISVL